MKRVVNKHNVLQPYGTPLSEKAVRYGNVPKT
jgi:hypothetical protein